jgi:hypothetical protein
MQLEKNSSVFAVFGSFSPRLINIGDEGSSPWLTTLLTLGEWHGFNKMVG